MSVSSFSSFSCLYARPGDGFHGRRSAYRSFQVGASRRGRPLRLARATQQDGDGDGGLVKMEMSGDVNSAQGGEGGGGGGFLQPIQWLFGSLFVVAIPIWRRIQNLDKTVEKIDSVVETVENVADKIGNIAEDISDELPEGGRLQKFVDKIEDFAEKVEDGASTVDNVLDKISDSLDDLEDAAEEAEKMKAKQNHEKTR